MAVSSRGLLRLAIGIVLLSPLAGCGMSSLTSGIGGGLFGGKPSTPGGPLSEEQMLSAAKADTAGSTGAVGEVAHGCPKFAVWPRDNHLTIYETGRAGDGLAIVHRGEITQTARECHIEPGRVVVKYGFSGRVLLGPKGRTSVVTLPVNLFVTDAKREKIITDRMKVDVQITLEKPIGYFSVVRTVTIPVQEGARPGEYEVYVGFDRAAPGAG